VHSVVAKSYIVYERGMRGGSERRARSNGRPSRAPNVDVASPRGRGPRPHSGARRRQAHRPSTRTREAWYLLGPRARDCGEGIGRMGYVRRRLYSTRQLVHLVLANAIVASSAGRA